MPTKTAPKSFNDLFGITACVSACAVQTPEMKNPAGRKGATPLGADENSGLEGNTRSSIDEVNLEDAPVESDCRLVAFDALGPVCPNGVDSFTVLCSAQSVPHGESSTPCWNKAGVTADTDYVADVTAFSAVDKCWCFGMLVAVREGGSSALVRFADKTEEWVALPVGLYFGTVGGSEIKRVLGLTKSGNA
jgi:hypothetical protein